MKRISLGLALILFSAFISGCTNGQATPKEKDNGVEEKKEIIISAAASLNEPMKEIKEVYEKNNNVTLTFNFGASGSLQKQIEEGAPVDIFISAGQKQFDTLKAQGFILENSKKDIVENELVLIVNKDYLNKIKSIEDIEALKGTGQYIALGETGSVPAGQYAEEALRYYDRWDAIDENIVFAKDVKQVINYVESGEASCGIVYKSDAIHIKNSEIVEVFASKSHKSILYPGGVIENSKVKEEAERFLEFLTSKEGQEILKQYGFKLD